MDEYIDQILAEMPDSALHDVVQNILDEPIPQAVKGRLLKPLQPRKYRPTPAPRKKKAAKRKAIEEEFDPIPRHKVLRTVKDYQDEILDLFAENNGKKNELTFRQTPWVIGDFLRGWQMDVPEGHPQGADPRAFLEHVEPQIQKKLEEELKGPQWGDEVPAGSQGPASEGQPRRQRGVYRSCSKASQAGGPSAAE